jgi:hypothetical protein
MATNITFELTEGGQIQDQQELSEIEARKTARDQAFKLVNVLSDLKVLTGREVNLGLKQREYEFLEQLAEDYKGGKQLRLKAGKYGSMEVTPENMDDLIEELERTKEALIDTMPPENYISKNWTEAAAEAVTSNVGRAVAGISGSGGGRGRPR